MPESEIIEFGRRLRDIRKRRGLDQAALAETARVPVSSISHFERGRRKPNWDTLKRLADGLKVSIDYLFGRTKNPQAHEDDTDKYAPNVLLTPKEVEAVEDWLEYVKERPRNSGGPREKGIPEDKGDRET